MAGEAPDAFERTARNIGIGCLTLVSGLFSGAMVAVLIGKFVGQATGCAPGPSGQPCNWHIYAGWGALIGGTSLPLITLYKLRRADAREDAEKGEQSNRG